MICFSQKEIVFCGFRLWELFPPDYPPDYQPGKAIGTWLLDLDVGGPLLAFTVSTESKRYRSVAGK